MTNIKITKFSGSTIIFILLFLSSGSVVNGQTANIIAFGDSVTAGFGSSGGGYPPKLSALLNTNSKPSIVANRGSSGESTSQGVARIGGVLASWPANIILIMHGENDIVQGISVETTRFNLESMINQSRAAGLTPIIATLTPNDKNGLTNTIAYTWNPMIMDLASTTGTPLADQYSAILPTWGTSNIDGLHPNEEGHWILARTWYGVISTMISETGEVIPEGIGGGGGGGGCFIATAAFGSPVEKHVQLLKDFRDSYLLTNSPGKAFVRAYYEYSPPVADFIRKHKTVKLAVRIMLYPLIGVSLFLLKLSIPLQFTITGLLAGCLAISAIFVRRRRY